MCISNLILTKCFFEMRLMKIFYLNFLCFHSKTEFQSWYYLISAYANPKSQLLPYLIDFPFLFSFLCEMNTLANRCSFSKSPSFSRSVHILATVKEFQKFYPMKMPSNFKSVVGGLQLSVQCNSNRFFSQEPPNLSPGEAMLQRSREAHKEQIKKLVEELERVKREGAEERKRKLRRYYLCVYGFAFFIYSLSACLWYFGTPSQK